MFGFLTAPCGCFSAEARSTYRGHFCGLCNVMSKEYGLPARFLINRDSTFVALLASAQLSEEASVTWTTCCNPLGKKRPLYQSSEAMRMVAAVTLSGLQTKTRDDRSDERFLKRLGLPLVDRVFRSAYGKAQIELNRMHFPTEQTSALLREQETREKAFMHDGASWETIVEPTAVAFGNIVAHTARWSPVEQNRDALFRLGYALGELVYVTDCFEDYQEDLKWNRFNPLAVLTASRMDGLRTIKSDFILRIKESVKTVLQSFQELELRRYQDILSPIILSGIPKKMSVTLDIHPSIILGETSGSTKQAVEEERANKKRQRRSKNRKKENCCDACHCCDMPCPCGGCLDCGSCVKDSNSDSSCTPECCSTDGCSCCGDGCSCDCCSCN